MQMVMVMMVMLLMMGCAMASNPLLKRWRRVASLGDLGLVPLGRRLGRIHCCLRALLRARVRADIRTHFAVYSVTLQCVHIAFVL